jgi:hypothetical protein
MTVDDEAVAVEEIDRNAALLCPGWVPSKMFRGDALAEGRQHSHDGHTCEKAQIWEELNSNRYLALLLKTTFDRDEANSFDWHQTGLEEEHFAALGFHLCTGLIEPEPEELTQLITAFFLWTRIRRKSVLGSIDSSFNPEDVMSGFMWEGFLAGAAFALSLEKLRVGSE